MAIGIADNFLYQGRKPLDSRIVKDTITDMTDMAESIIHDGIMVYNKETEKFYVFNSNNTVDATLKKWREFSGSPTDANATISEYGQDKDYKKNELVIFDNKMYLVANDFKSDNTESTIVDSFKKDLDNGNLIIVSSEATDDDIKCKEYQAGENYKKGTLLIADNKLYIVTNDFTSSNSESTLADNFDLDLKNGAISPVDTDTQITDTHSVEYKQAEKYEKGNLVVFDEKLYIVLRDFTADNTETTIEDSCIKDIDLGNLSPIDTDTDTNCIEYAQNQKYTTNKIIRHNNKLYVVSTDFTSNSTESNSDLSFEKDFQNGNLIPVVSETKVSKVLAYTQATKYDKDTLVYIGNKIARVDIDYTSDSTALTVEDSFNLDVANSHLVLVNAEDLAVVLPYAQDTDYLENTLVFLGEKIARVEGNYKSDNTVGNTLELSFETDIKNNKISLINTDHVKIMNEYNQSNMYFKDTLVYHNNLITRVMNDFIADSTATTTDDSFDKDVTAGNLLILNKEADVGIKPYKQGTFFAKNKLVFADGRIGRVLNDYISDNTGATVEESINIDIANGNLRELAENYRFKLYKTTKDMDKTIDAMNTLPISSIIFENGETILNMQINEAVYGPLGTLALIKEIDKNNGIIKVKTINSREMEFMPPAPNIYKYTITLAGTGFSVGEIVPTTEPNVNVEVVSVDSNGGITDIQATNATITNANGVGQTIDAELILYAGNGKQWYEMPEKNNANAIIKEYTQGETYTKDTLIFLGDILARATQNFISDNSLATTKDSFKFDLDSSNIIRMTREDVNVPECLGSVKTDNAADLPALAIKGNWVLIDNCVNTAPNQAGIGLYNGTTWDISPIPQGTFNFPEPNADGNLYFRKRDIGATDGQWEKFTTVNGNDVEVTIKTKSDLTDNSYVPKANELVWDTNRKILVIGDGTTSLGSLKEFYGKGVSSTDIITAIGYTPENAAEKGQANGYAPLDANGIVPTANLPASLTDTYSKTEIDTKDTNTLNTATGLVNTEAARAKGVESGLRTDLDAHIADNVRHVTQTEKDTWNAKVEKSDLTKYDNHLSDTVIHVTQADKDKWNGMNKAYYVTSVTDLPLTGNQIGNIGYVQVSAAGVTPVVCDQYLWDGTAWRQMDGSKVSLTFTWGNLQGKPSSTPLSIDNTVTVAHNHTNKNVLDKIGQSAAGNFTYDGVEIGVKVIFLANENLLPAVGEEDTLYVIYEDSRVRNYPSISVYRDGSYQILGRGTQDSAPVVGDMSILQSEYFSVVKGSKYNITVTSNQYFAFMPVEILREIEGLKDQEKIILELNDPANFTYNEDMLSISSANKLTISIKDRKTILDTVSSFYYSHVDINLDDFKDIDNIG